MSLVQHIIAVFHVVAAIWSQVAAGGWITRNASSDLLLPPDASSFSLIVSSSDDCTYLIAPYNGCCCIYDFTTHKCTIVSTDRFQLVQSYTSLEVGILSKQYCNLKHFLYLNYKFTTES